MKNNSKNGGHKINVDKLREFNFDKIVIDEYFINGFKGGRAVVTAKGADYEKVKASDSTQFNLIMQKPENKKYLDEKRALAGIEAEATHRTILRELMNWVNSDATDYIGLTMKEVKQLPANVKRCIQSIDYKVNRYTTRDGRPMEEEVIKVKLTDKTKAIDAISKHIGFYGADNNQKATKINLNKFDNTTLNNILNVINEEDNNNNI